MNDFSHIILKLNSYKQDWKGGEGSQCPGSGQEDCINKGASMSKRDLGTRPLNPPEAQRSAILPSIQPRNDAEGPGTGTTTGEASLQASELATRSSQFQEDRYHPFISQPLPPRDSLTQRSTPSRGFGVHNILNPTDAEQSNSLRRQSDTGYSPLAGSSYAASNSPRSSLQDAFRRPPITSPPMRSSQELRQEPRRILTPRSPRAASYGSHRGTIDAQQTPFLGGRTYSVEPGVSDVPPLPTQAPSGLRYAPSPTIDHLRTHASMTSLIDTRPPSSTSPTPSLTPSYGSQTATTTRGTTEQGGGPASYFPGQSFGAPRPGGSTPQSGPQGAEGPFTSERNFLALQGAQTNIRMMPLTSADGAQFYVPVDVQAASKVADEKRARNAGASARFRERRKAKEKEASTAIQKLEQQNKELERRAKEFEDQMNRYKEERDRFKDIIQRTPTISHLAAQVPQSPRESRLASYTGPSTQAWEGSLGISQERNVSGRPSRRRRTEEQVAYNSYSYPNPPATLPPVPSPHYGSLGTEPRPTNLPPLRQEPVQLQSTGSMTVSSQSAAVQGRSSYESYPRRDYERGWVGSGPPGASGEDRK